jgi:hypothetical protein
LLKLAAHALALRIRDFAKGHAQELLAGHDRHQHVDASGGAVHDEAGFEQGSARLKGLLRQN